MGYFKESNAELFSSMVLEAPSGFTQPTYIGLLEIIKRLGLFHDDQEPTFARRNKTVFERAEYFVEEQLCFSTDEARSVSGL